MGYPDNLKHDRLRREVICDKTTDESLETSKGSHSRCSLLPSPGTGWTYNHISLYPGRTPRPGRAEPKDRKWKVD